MINNFKTFYKKYGEYVNYMRMIPSGIDGLRLVERRVLYSVYLEAKEKFKKSAYIVGKANILHPHGDSSIYGTLVKLVNFNFAIGQGNWGTRVGIEDDPPAAQRYTEVKLNNLVNNLAFDLIKFCNYSILEYEEEPLNLPTMIPLGLLFQDINSGIGFGIKTTIPSYKLTDLVKRLIYLLDNTKEKVIPVPYYDDELQCLSDTTKCEQLITTGEGSITFRPKLYISEKDRKIEIKSRPLGKKFTSLITSLDNELKNGIISFIDKSTTSTNIEIGIVKNKKYDFQKLVKTVEQKVTSTITFKSFFVENDAIVLKSIDRILLDCYEHYKQCFTKKVNNRISELQSQITDLEMINKIRPHINYVIDKKLDKESSLQYLSQQTNIHIQDIKTVITKYNIEKLINVHIDSTELQQKLTELKNMNITKQISKQYENLIH